MKPAELSITELERAVQSFGNDALAGARAVALERFRTRGFPTTRDEDWKYTDLAPVIDISERWLHTPRDASPDLDTIGTAQKSIHAAWLVIANGHLLRDHSTVFSEYGIQVSALEGEPLSIDHPLSDLNLALLEDGAILRVTREYRDERPIGLLILDSSNESAAAAQVRVDMQLDANARARFIEYHCSSGSADHYSNVHLNLNIADGAGVDYLRFQDRALSHTQTGRLNVTLGRDASFHHGSVDLGGRMIRNDLQVDLNGKGASATFDGLYVAGSGQHIDNHTRVDHRVGPAVSRQEYRGVIGEHGRAVWNGKAIVHKGADGTDAEQANHNLLLSKHAEIDAKPELEIYADEVKCAHGTTVGQLDEKALFYLRSRGIDKDRAERIIIRAFAATIVAKSPIAELREMIGDKVEQRLRAMSGGAAL